MAKVTMIQKIKKKIIPLLKNGGVKKAGIFGSYAKGKSRKNSDIDILIEIAPNASLLKIMELKLKLEKATKKKIDLVEYCSLHPLIKKDVLKEEIRIL